MPSSPRIWLTTLGCAKNQVDSEKITARLGAAGAERHHDSQGQSGAGQAGEDGFGLVHGDPLEEVAGEREVIDPHPVIGGIVGHPGADANEGRDAVVGVVDIDGGADRGSAEASLTRL